MFKMPIIDVPLACEIISAKVDRLNSIISVQPKINSFSPIGASILNKERNKTNLISYPLPGRSQVVLISTLFHDTNEISVELILGKYDYGKDIYHLIGNIDYKFGFIPLHHKPNTETINLNCGALIRTVMWNNEVNTYEGPTYDEVKNDRFWIRFIKETIEFATIASVQHT